VHATCSDSMDFIKNLNFLNASGEELEATGTFGVVAGAQGTATAAWMHKYLHKFYHLCSL